MGMWVGRVDARMLAKSLRLNRMVWLEAPMLLLHVHCTFIVAVPSL